MKIGISCYPTFGGSGLIASELGVGLAERGHEVHFITYASPGRLNIQVSGIFFHEVSVPDYPLFEYPPYSLALASKIAECVEKHGIELIHAHYAIPHTASALLARDIVGKDKLKVVTTLHGTDITLVGSDPSFLPVTKYSIERSDAVSVVSMFLKDEIDRVFSCRNDIKVIHNFINPLDYQCKDRESLHAIFAPKDEKILIHVSNFRKVKRIQDVIKIFIGVRKLMKTRLILIGDGPELNAAIESVKGENAYEDLIVLGSRDSVEEIIGSADLLLLPSETESFGMAALEAMAAGVPPLASNVGGLPEVIDDGITGCLTTVGDVDEMIRRAIELLSDENKRRQMGENARGAAFNKFNINTALDEYEDLYGNGLN
ncbi:N-acetyl-alpha-D-glucosaminyl L-malate synthase BshA [bacterium]|nr:N-acetyl-alpha-D-glucosaminyl L-malate synthase BshA [bacterium]